MAWLTVVLLAKKREKGRTPSLAISCLTVGGKEEKKEASALPVPQPSQSCAAVPLDAVKVMTTMLPNTEKAMRPAMTRGASSVPKTSSKKTVAMSMLP